MHGNGYSLALMGAVYGLLGFFMVQLALAACYLVVWYALAGNFAAVVFIGVDYADTEKGALKFIDKYGLTYFNGPDLGTRISAEYRIRGVPETFYVAKNGELQGLKIGPLAPGELEFKILELLDAR